MLVTVARACKCQASELAAQYDVKLNDEPHQEVGSLMPQDSFSVVWEHLSKSADDKLQQAGCCGPNCQNNQDDCASQIGNKETLHLWNGACWVRCSNLPDGFMLSVAWFMLSVALSGQDDWYLPNHLVNFQQPQQLHW